MLSTVIAIMDMNFPSVLTNCITLGIDLTAISYKAGNSSDLTYIYSTDPEGKIPISNPKRITRSGTYYVKGFSSSGCSMIKPVNVIITPSEAFVITPPAPVTYPKAADITAAYVRVPGWTYSYWKDPEATIALITPEFIRFGGTFYIKGTNPEGCVSIMPVLAEVIIPDILIPNTFTPNGDGINDVLTLIIDNKVKVSSLKIYSRWGQQVFITSDITKMWDGFTNGSKVPAGLYYWVLEGVENNKKYLRSGFATLIR
jgi:gliding motility-associated-like protein